MRRGESRGYSVRRTLVGTRGHWRSAEGTREQERRDLPGEWGERSTATDVAPAHTVSAVTSRRKVMSADLDQGTGISRSGRPVVARGGSVGAGRAACGRRYRAHRRSRTTPPAAVGDGTQSPDHPRSGVAQSSRTRHGVRGGALRDPPTGRPRTRAHAHRDRCHPRLDHAPGRRSVARRAPS